MDNFVISSQVLTVDNRKNHIHILITRFNLKIETDKGWLRASEEWMEHRWELFINYCVPSVLAQTTKSFIWIIYFDHKTSQHFRRKIDILCKQNSNIIPVYVETFKAFTRHLPVYILDEYARHYDYVITTRLIMTIFYIQKLWRLFKILLFR
ncbi:MAG: hypothetical protein D3909_02370 [Candidatus Electrothrix sp. ATG1]|nr:hypothetical protein [Candidatus Electrothrix sp. ATG1]